MTLTAEPVTDNRAWTAREVTAALWQHLTAQSWAVVTEIAAEAVLEQTMLGDFPWQRRVARRIDVLGVRRARNQQRDGDLERLAIEVKVSRADFLSDVARPEKQAPWRAVAHRHAYAAPAGLIRPEEIPAGSGLLEVKRGGYSGSHTVRWALRAPFETRPGELPSWLVSTLAHRLSSAEARMRGLVDADGQSEEELRGDVERLRREVERLGSRLERMTEQSNAYRAAAGAAGHPIPCGTCGEPIRPLSPRQGALSRWRHVDKAADGPCEQQRHELAESNARAAWQQMSDGDSHRSGVTFYEDLAARHGQEPWQLHAFYAVTPVQPADDAPDDEPEGP